MPQTIPLIHSTYNSNTGTSAGFTGQVINITVPSVVDGILVLLYVQFGSPTVTFGAQSFTQIGSISGGTSIWFLPKPIPSTNDITVAFGTTARAGVFVILLESTLPSSYARDNTGNSGTGTGFSGFPTFVTGDLQFAVMAWNNRDTVGLPTFVGNSATIHNTIINSGGGASSFGFMVDKNDGAVGSGFVYGFGSSMDYGIRTVSIKNSVYNTAGTLTIRHAP